VIRDAQNTRSPTTGSTLHHEETTSFPHFAEDGCVPCEYPPGSPQRHSSIRLVRQHRVGYRFLGSNDIYCYSDTNVRNTTRHTSNRIPLCLPPDITADLKIAPVPRPTRSMQDPASKYGGMQCKSGHSRLTQLFTRHRWRPQLLRNDQVPGTLVPRYFRHIVIPVPSYDLLLCLSIFGRLLSPIGLLSPITHSIVMKHGITTSLSLDA
jgi:hypothetical protein